MNKIIIVCGPTASGKSDYAIKVAQNLKGEIISADSMQIYKHMDIGTAKIKEVEMQGIKHHMLDIIEPYEEFSVADYKERAFVIINNLLSKNITPIVTGGTGLYISSILYNMSFTKTSKNTQLREQLNSEYDQNGGVFMLNKLIEIDKESASKLHPNDKKRIVRALEINLSSQEGKSFEEEIINSSYQYEMIGLNYDRELLYQNINKRVDKMFDLGLLDEIKGLLEKGCNFLSQSFQAIGYKEFKEYFNGNKKIEEVKELIKKNTRNYAKRQITWFKRYSIIKWVNPYEAEV